MEEEEEAEEEKEERDEEEEELVTLLVSWCFEPSQPLEEEEKAGFWFTF